MQYSFKLWLFQIVSTSFKDVSSSRSPCGSSFQLENSLAILNPMNADVAVDALAVPVPSVAGNLGALDLRTRTSGFQSRRTRRQLPKPVLLYCTAKRSIVGAATFVSFCESQTADCVEWMVTNGAELTTYMVILQSQRRYNAPFFKLTAQAELEVRRAELMFGGTINDHVCSMDSILVMRSQWAHIEPLVSPGTKRLETHKSFARYAGILPDTAAEDPREVGETVLSEDDGALDEEEVVEAGLLAGDEQEVAEQGQSHIGFLRTRLRHMYYRSGGTVTHRYTPMAILSYLHLQGLCRPGATAKDALSSCCRLIFGQDGKPLSDEPLRQQLQQQNPAGARSGSQAPDPCVHKTFVMSSSDDCGRVPFFELHAIGAIGHLSVLRERGQRSA